MNLTKFQFSVTHNHRDDIKAFIGALAQERGNKNLEALGTEYHFTTWWHADMYDGYRVALAKDIAELCYGSRNVTNLLRLGAVYGLASYNLGSETRNYVSLVKEHFGLARTVNTASLLHWPYILLVGARGETEGARKLWAYIQTMREFAEADLESREQTGVGVVENIQAQHHHVPGNAPLVHLATDEFEAMKRLLIALGYHPTTAMITAAQYAHKETGFDMAPYLNNSPQMLHAPTETQYYPVSVLEEEHKLPFHQRKGHFLNQLLAQRGLQVRNAREEWEPTPLAHQERIHGVPIQVKAATASGVWSGYILKWHPDYIKGVVTWYQMKHAPQRGQ